MFIRAQERSTKSRKSRARIIYLGGELGKADLPQEFASRIDQARVLRHGRQNDRLFPLAPLHRQHDVLQCSELKEHRRDLADRAQLQATEYAFFTTFGWPGTVERMAKLRQRGIGSPGEFELNFGQNIGDLQPG